MATKKTAVIPEEEILAAATEENINEHSLHQTETEPEPDRVLSAEGAPGDADLIDICQTDSRSANPEGMPIEDAARNTPEAPVSQTGSDTELLGEFPAGSDELTAPEAPASQTDSDLDEKKPEESPPARRTRKPRAKKSESDTAAAEPPGDASDGVESPEKKPRRRAAARPASPVVSIDERPSVETEADKARNDLLDLVESLKTKRILTGTIQGIERPTDHPSRSLAVIYHGDIKVIIPAEEAVEPPEDFRGRLPEDVLHYMVTKRLGAEVDYIIKGIDAKAGVAVGSRLEAMSAKRRAYYFGTDRDGNNLLYEGICAEARVVSVIRAGIFVDLFGLEVYIPLRELSYQRMLDAQDSFQPGQRILVKILSIDRSDRTRIRVSASIKQAGENPYEKALRRYSVGNRYVGTVSMVDMNGVFVSLDGGIDCLCSYPKRGRPPRGSRVTVRILGINNESNRIWGAITHIAKLIYGSVSGLKVDANDKPLSGAVMGLFAASETRFTKDTALLTAVSAEDGRFRFEKIPAGNWLVREIEQPKGFVLSEELFPVTVKEQGQVIEIKIANKLIRGSVTLTKYDADYPENKLSGAVFEVYRDVNGNKALDKDDVLLGTMEESSAGVYWMKNLEYGGVLVREKTAPEGFIPDEKAYYVEIDTDGKTYTVENEAGKGFINHALKGSLKIIKTTSDGKKEGFAFRITGTNGYDMTFTTDAKGEIFIEKLRIGEYTVTELKNSASEGYKIADPVKITLVANETLTVKIHNDKTKVDVPKTGDDADLMLWISLLGLAAAGVGCTAFFYLKKRRTGKHIAVKK